ncbi:MAG TPA: hypothetical protein VEI74_08500 [Candidatus Methylomirabilis sp.]|nr:hypothetical protein [Candidatus Methylomirabilis sp.]
MIDTYFVRGNPFTHIASKPDVSVVWNTLLSPSPTMTNLLAVPWNLLFPPANSQRMSPAFQLRRINSAPRIKR